MICENCQREKPVEYAVTFRDGSIVYVCSVSCLTEWAWKLRGMQPKLSKSKLSDLGRPQTPKDRV